MEALLRAEASSDLSEVRDGICDVDWLRASGMVSQYYPIAFAVWRLCESGDRSAAREAFDLSVQYLVRRGYDSDPCHVAASVLGWLARPTCEVCRGRKFETEPGTPSLTDRVCPACHGTGKKEKAWADPGHALFEHIAEQQRMAAGAVLRKLKQ